MTKRQYRKSKSGRKKESSIFDFLKKWIVEILLAFLVLVFLLWILIPEDYIQSFFLVSQELLVFLTTPIIDFLGLLLSPTVIISLLFIIFVAIILIMRIRYHIKRNAVDTNYCPVCDNKIHRRHRKPIHHFLSLFIPVRYYYCKSCGWQGLRISSKVRRKK